MCKPLLLALAAAFPAFVALAAAAQSLPVQAESARYHFGDNPAWADPHFDDSAWPEAKNGRWPYPHGGGFVWVRLRIPLPAASTTPLALRETSPQLAPPAEQIFLNGALLGANGNLPPHNELWTAPPNLVFPLSGLPGAQPGLAPPATAVIAVRAWINPGLFEIDTYASRFTLADLATQQALAHEERISLQLKQVPFAVVGFLEVLVGLALVAIGLAVGRRELLLFAIVLIAGPLQAVLYRLTDSRAIALPYPLFAPTGTALLILVPTIYTEFLWQALRLPGRGWKFTIQGLSVLAGLAFLGMMLVSNLPLSAAMDTTSASTGTLRDLLEAAAAAWAMAHRRSGRWLAFGVFLTPAASIVAFMGEYYAPPRWAAIGDAFFEDVAVLGALVIAAILVARAFSAWRYGQRLQSELDAAREVQQRLVPAALPAIGCFRVQAEYLPAQEVGGDFYQILPQPGGSALIIVGDVSGKGLKAAMTGSLALGALRTLAQEALSPAQILSRLNMQLAADSDGGFITCLCARIAADGTLALANAGHLSPYKNGDELPLESGLPLGIVPDAAYAESTFQLAPNDRLTLLSDGVVEAQSATGELFGFDRTRQISTQSAEAIAAAAQAHGQEDDITVLTLTYAPAEVLHA